MLDLRMQDPGASGGHLLEALLDACAGADRGGGIFAWANSAGAKLLLSDETFVTFAATGTFDLVVGTDTITDERAVNELAHHAAALPNLTVRAFLHGKGPNVMFHPKLAWFGTGTHVRLLVGSGNLTKGGTQRNWEAFAVVDLDGAAAKDLEQQLGDWATSWNSCLLPLDDPRVLERVRRNTGRESDLKRLGRLRELGPSPEAVVLVAELPRAGDRWNQANFDVENYEAFFGAKVGSRTHIVLTHVAADGSLEAEARQSVQVKSKNYRFELAAARGLPYPAAGRPIGVFVKRETGGFLYRLLMPGGSGYAAASTFLDGSWSGRADRMRRVRTTVADLRVAWPDSPLWKAALD